MNVCLFSCTSISSIHRQELAVSYGIRFNDLNEIGIISGCYTAIVRSLCVYFPVTSWLLHSQCMIATGRSPFQKTKYVIVLVTFRYLVDGTLKSFLVDGTLKSLTCLCYNFRVREMNRQKTLILIRTKGSRRKGFLEHFLQQSLSLPFG